MIDPRYSMRERYTVGPERLLRMRASWLWLALWLLLWGAASVRPASPADFSLEGGASRSSWSGYWWPFLITLGSHLYDEVGPFTPLAKYGQATGDPGPLAWEKRYKLTTDPSTSWWGHSTGWAAATLFEPEPVRSVRAGSVVFGVGEIKGLLTAAHNGDPADTFAGARHDQGADYRTDLRARDFHRAVLYYLRDRREALIFNLSAKPEVWNYPAYAFRMTGVTDPRNPSLTNVTVTLTFADDEVQPNFVGIKSFSRTYTYWVQGDPQAISGNVAAEWTGDSVVNHPQFLWHPAYQRAYDPAWDGQPNPLDYNWVRQLAQVAGDAGPATSELMVDPPRLAFGRMLVGTTQTQSVVLRNTGTRLLTGTVGSLDAPFGVAAGAGSFSLAPGTSQEVKVGFTPTRVSQPGEFQATLTIRLADPGAAPISVAITGESAGI